MHHEAPIAHCVMFSDLASARAGDALEIGADEAHHAVRVKRLRTGETVGVLDGCGRFAIGTLDEIAGSRSKPLLNIGLQSVEVVDPIRPALSVYAALPKGDRLDRMIDQLTQIGVSAFHPLLCEHAQRKPDNYRPEKLERIVEEAMKQSRRAWRMEIGDPIALNDAIEKPGAIVADASGEVWGPEDTLSTNPTLIVGPEGGWSNTERELIVNSGVRVCRFGMLVMRIETAAVTGASVLMNTPNPS